MARKALIKIKPKKYKIGDIVKVSFISIHPMETGQRKDKTTGELKPIHYIDNVKFYYGDVLISEMNVWETISTNPLFSIYMKIDKKAPIKVTYTDNLGEKAEYSKKVKPKG